MLDITYGFNAGTANNGNIASWSAVGQQSFNRSYTYDSLNRLSTLGDSKSGNPCPGLSWSYDAWGNRTNQTVTSGTCGASQLTINTKNQISNTGILYDAAGNMINDGTHTYTFDAENRLTSVDGGSTATYVYDALGRRVEKIRGSTQTWYDYDINGNVMNDWNQTSSIDYIYLNGQLIVQYICCSTYFVHKDHLRSTRLLTGMDKSVYDSMDYLPFGEQIAGDTGTTHKFTGKERDGTTLTETGLDYFGARYDSSQYGRFMTPDEPLIWSDKENQIG